MGKVELVLSRDALKTYNAKGEETIRWTDIKLINVRTQSSNWNFFLAAASSFIAVLRGAPSNRKIELQKKKGSPLVLNHWHFDKNVPEVEVLIRQLWQQAQS